MSFWFYFFFVPYESTGGYSHSGREKSVATSTQWYLYDKQKPGPSCLKVRLNCRIPEATSKLYPYNSGCATTQLRSLLCSYIHLYSLAMQTSSYVALQPGSHIAVQHHGVRVSCIATQPLLQGYSFEVIGWYSAVTPNVGQHYASDKSPSSE